MNRPDLSIIDVFHSETPAATEFRRILYRLLKKKPDNDHKSVLVTSSTLSEGKSTVSSLLAICAAKKGLRTLLIDADLRRPTIHTMFRVARDPGLADILVNGATTKSATVPTPLDNLDIITAGKVIGHPAEVFDAVAIGRIIEEAKFYYDLIIIDSAPVIPVSDPMLLSQEVDGIVLVIRAGKTQKEVVDRAVDIVAADRSRLLGVVMNNISASLPYYYDDKYYGYDYSPSSDTGEKSQNPEGKKNGANRDKHSGKNHVSGNGKPDPRSSTGKISR